MRFFSPHLDHPALSDSLVGLSSSATDAHLASCPACRADRDRLRADLAAVAAAAAAVADDAMPPGALEQQRQSIRQRIGRLGSGARLLAFPPAATPRLAEPARPDRRWIAAAAVAGLLVGVGVGRLQNGGTSLAETSTGSIVAGSPRAEGAGVEPWRDDPLLSDIDAVLARETRPEFEALDGLTPISDDGR